MTSGPHRSGIGRLESGVDSGHPVAPAGGGDHQRPTVGGQGSLEVAEYRAADGGLEGDIGPDQGIRRRATRSRTPEHARAVAALGERER